MINIWPFNNSKKEIKIESIKPKNSYKRSFNAALVNRLNEDFKSNIASINADIYSSLSKIRARSRNLSLNNDYYIKFLNLYLNNVIGGQGFTLVSRVRDDNGKIDKNACDQIEKAWNKFCMSSNFSANKQDSFHRTMTILGTSYPRDGEFFLRLIYGFNNEFGFTTQILLPEYLDETYNEDLSNGNYIRSAIEYNSWGEPVAYHFTEKNKNENINSVYIAKFGNKIRISADEIIHLYNKKEGGQCRGYPFAQQALIKLHMIDGTEDAELVSRRASACKMGFVSKKDNGEYNGDAEDSDGNKILEMEAGIIERLDAGDEFMPFDPSHSGDGNALFVKLLLKGISAGSDISYQSLSNDFEGVSKEALRLIESKERDRFKLEQRYIIDDLICVVFNEWLKISLTLKIINLPISKIDKFKEHIIRPRSFDPIDASEYMQNASDIANGLDSRTNILSKKNMEIEDIFNELGDEETSSQESGFPLRNQGGTTSHNLGAPVK